MACRLHTETPSPVAGAHRVNDERHQCEPPMSLRTHSQKRPANVGRLTLSLLVPRPPDVVGSLGLRRIGAVQPMVELVAVVTFPGSGNCGIVAARPIVRGCSRAWPRHWSAETSTEVVPVSEAPWRAPTPGGRTAISEVPCER